MDGLNQAFSQDPKDMPREPREQDLQALRPSQAAFVPTEAGTIQIGRLQWQGSKSVGRRHVADGAETALQGADSLRRLRETAPRDCDSESGRSASPPLVVHYPTLSTSDFCAHSVLAEGPAHPRDDLNARGKPNPLRQDQEPRPLPENHTPRGELEEKLQGQSRVREECPDNDLVTTAEGNTPVRGLVRNPTENMGLKAELEDAPSHNLVEADESSKAAGELATKLKRENMELKAELEDARSHIFSLQPYRKDLTPEEAGRDFDELLQTISDWVLKFAEPIVDNPTLRDSFVAAAKEQHRDILKLRRFILDRGDFVNGLLYPDTDIDILIAIVLRYIHENIFQKVLLGGMRDAGEIVTAIEGSMQTNVEPKRDQFSIRTWRAEAFAAILGSPEYQAHRLVCVKKLTFALGDGLRLFRDEKDPDSFLANCRDNVILPAMQLHEKFLMSTHHFYLDVNPYTVLNKHGEMVTSLDFVNNLDNLKCENMLQNRRPLNLAKLDPPPTEEDLRANLFHVVTVAPGLYTRQIGRGDAIKPAVVVRKQHVLVAYGPQEARDRFTSNAPRTLMNLVYFSPLEKPERLTGPSGPWMRRVPPRIGIGNSLHDV